MMHYKPGEKLLVIDGDHKDQFGIYLNHTRDSGYLVPHVLLKDQVQIKPWDREVISHDEILTNIREAQANLDLAQSQLLTWEAVTVEAHGD
jgi:hypothetical protein